MTRHLLRRAASLAMILALANAAGLVPGGVPHAAAAWSGSINVYVNTGDGAGRVTSDDGGIDCVFADNRATGDCEQTYVWADLLSSVLVGITYTPATGSYVCLIDTLSCTTSGAPVSYNLEFKRGQTNQAVISPSFWLKTYQVLADAQGPGSVSVNGGACTPPSGIDDCGSFKHGSTVTLVATPDGDYPFNGWAGHPCGAATTCSFTITSQPSDSYTAIFGQIYVVIRSGGGGKVCKSDGVFCTRSGMGFAVQKHESVTIIAVPDAGWTFDGWSVAPCLGKPATCTFTALADVDVTASFRKLATAAPSSPPASPRPTASPRATVVPSGVAASSPTVPSSTGPAASSAPPTDAAPTAATPSPDGTQLGAPSLQPSGGPGGMAAAPSSTPSSGGAPVVDDRTSGGADVTVLLALLVMLAAILVGTGVFIGRRGGRRSGSTPPRA